MASSTSSGTRIDLSIDVGPVVLKGYVCVPARARSIVIFAHGSGSGYMSPRNRFVAHTLNKADIATLLFDLLDESEANDRRLVFDIDFLTERLIRATEWIGTQRALDSMAIGYFGASTGAAAALQAAARLGTKIKAVVSRGGRPDLAGNFLADVQSPTLLIVGGEDDAVIPLNERAYEKLTCEKEFVIIPGATHLFEEPGALEKVAEHATKWFKKFLVRTRRPEIEVTL